MAKGEQRGARDESEKGTHQIRVNGDVGEMISWIIRVEGGTTATLLDPMIRAQVTARYEKHLPRIEKIRAAQEALEQAEREAKANLEEERQAEKPAGKKKRPQ